MGSMASAVTWNMPGPMRRDSSVPPAKPRMAPSTPSTIALPRNSAAMRQEL